MTRRTSIDDPSQAGTRAIPFSSADLLLDLEGRVYHLQLLPEEVASDIILVGDPGRALFIAEHFLCDIELRREHRGLRSFTGKSRYDGHRVSVITSGMGTPSLEIVVQEISILKHIDLHSRTPKPSSEPVQIIRVGTSGGLQASTPLGTAVLTRYAIGFDNTGLFYEAPAPDENCRRLELELYEYVQSHMPRSSRFYGRIWPYVTMASPPLLSRIMHIASACNYPLCEGITVSNSGFFANQGRDILPIHPSIPDLDLLLSRFEPRIENLRIENMEMEASALCHLGQGQGFFTACICPTVSNRRLETFADDYETHIARAVEISLKALSSHRKVLESRAQTTA
jgi:uridine phosphorylase